MCYGFSMFDILEAQELSKLDAIFYEKIPREQNAMSYLNGHDLILHF